MYQDTQKTQSTCPWCLKPYIGYSSFSACLRPASLLCRSCWKKLCYRPGTGFFQGYPLYWSYEYNESFSVLLKRYKERRDQSLKQVFLMKQQSQFKKIAKGRQIILVPSTQIKQQQRGFNHLQGMLEGYGYHTYQVLENLQTKPQKELDLQQRKQIKIKLKMNSVSISNRILLVDDIMTSGQTLQHCLEVLKPVCSDIIMYIFAQNGYSTVKS